MKSIFVTLSIGVLLLLPGCGSTPSLSIVEDLPVAEGMHGSQPNLALSGDSEILLNWLDGSDPSAPRLKFAVKSSGGWSAAQTIAEAQGLLVNWADFPSLFALTGGGLAAHWLSTIPEGEGYNVNIAVSKDGGKSWSKPITPHKDGTTTEHGFVSLAAAPGGGVSVLWLDSRKLASGSDEVALMETRVDLDGTPAGESEIDGRVCECCQPSTIAVEGGLLGVYRDRTDSEIRDIAIIRFDGKQWSKPKIVFDDKWQIYACPIQGPAIAASGKNVVVTWFTEANEMPRVKAAFSSDGGDTFGQPIPIDEGNPIGRVDVAMLKSGSAVVTWIEHSDKGGEVKARQIESNGTRHDSLSVGVTSVGNSSGFPRVERNGEGAIVAWTDTNEHRIRTSVIR